MGVWSAASGAKGPEDEEQWRIPISSCRFCWCTNVAACRVMYYCPAVPDARISGFVALYRVTLIVCKGIYWRGLYTVLCGSVSW